MPIDNSGPVEPIIDPLPPGEEGTMELSTEILIMIGIMLLSIIGGNFLRKKHSRFLQEAGLTTMIGLTAGLVLYILSKNIYLENLQKHFRAIFLIILLPAIILESGFNMKKSSFYKNLGTVLMYAFVGTFVAILSLGLMVKGLAATGTMPEFSWRESFAFSALISATDPVTVLALFKEVNTDVNLYTMVFGESIFNDAICIVLYRSITEFELAEDKSTLFQVLAPFAEFLVVFFCSFLIGACAALIVAFILKKGKRSRTIKMNNEISMMILCPWVSYLIAEGLKFSGIVSILINGVFLAQYVAPNLSKMSKKVIKAGYETAAWGAESIVFLFIGIGIFAIDKPFEDIGGLGISLACICMNIARALNICITSTLCNITRRENKIGWKFQFILWVAGLRGAMAYALALESYNDYPSVGKVMLVITLIYALISVLITGSVLSPILGYVGVEKTEEDLQTQIDMDESFYGNDMMEMRRLNCGERFKVNLMQFNNKYFKPIFIVEKQEAEIIADKDTSDIQIESHPHEDIKRKSDSQLFEVNLDGNELQLTRLSKIRTSDKERQDLNNSI